MDTVVLRVSFSSQHRVRIEPAGVPQATGNRLSRSTSFEFNACSSYIDRVPTTAPSKLKWERRSDDNMI